MKAKLILLTTKARKDGTSPVVLRLSQGATRNYLFSGYYCKPEQWNDELSRFRSNFPKYKQANIILSHIEEKAEDILYQLSKKGQPFRFDLFKRQFEYQDKKKNSVFNYWEKIIKEMKSSGRVGNSMTYSNALNALKRYHKRDNLEFKSIDVSFLRKYKQWLKTQKNKRGEPLSDRTVSIYLRTLRAVYYRAIDDNLIGQELNPFGTGKHYFSVNEGLSMKTRKRAISKADILKIHNYRGQYQQTKDIFMFSYLAGGMNFTDLAKLQWKNITNGRIEYKRQKTGKEYSIKITEPIQAILDKYKGRKYVFPIILNDDVTPYQLKTRIKTALKKFNRELRLIAQELDIQAYLTSYTARHSMATVLYKEAGASVSHIQSLMGHSEEKITQVYLDSIDQSETDKLQEELL